MTATREFSDGELVPGTRYRVVAHIGAGGMGSVYEVEHVELGKRFVLKALLRNLTNRDDLVHRLRNEWRALGKLEHRNIVSVTDAGITTTGMPYFVMERLQGETLAGRLRRDRRVPVQEALAIAADVLEGLSAAHRIGIVHRDVKPPNVFLVAKRPAKLLDFGIAKVLDPKASQITGRGIAIGTPRYMAPEQATGEAVDARTDLYAVGLLLFEMIAGEGPFDRARDPNELFLAHIGKAAPSLTSIAPFAPPALDPWLARLLAKKPTHRPDDAEAVAAALRAVAAELAALSVRPLEREKEDPTLAGGPFDTLEGAQTIPSDGVSLGGVATRTGLGPASRAKSPLPPRAAVEQSGHTLRLDALSSGGEAPTRTAAPAPLPETPLPVAETPSPLPGPRVQRRWTRASLVVASLAALGGAAVVSVRHAGVAKGAARVDGAIPAVTTPVVARAVATPVATRALTSPAVAHAVTASAVPGATVTAPTDSVPAPSALGVGRRPTASGVVPDSHGGPTLAGGPGSARLVAARAEVEPLPAAADTAHSGVRAPRPPAKAHSAATHPTNSADSTMPGSGL